MKNTLSYKGYHARIEFDSEDRLFHGQIAGIEDGVGFHAESVDGLIAAFEEAVDDYLETCARLGRDPDKAFSGRLMLRVAPALHARLARMAALEGKSLNQFGEEVLSSALA